MKKIYNTPHRSRVVKTRMTEDEYADFSRQLSLYGISQAEFIRRAIRGLPIHPIIKVSPVNERVVILRPVSDSEALLLHGLDLSVFLAKNSLARAFFLFTGFAE